MRLRVPSIGRRLGILMPAYPTAHGQLHPASQFFSHANGVRTACVHGSGVRDFLQSSLHEQISRAQCHRVLSPAFNPGSGQRPTSRHFQRSADLFFWLTTQPFQGPPLSGIVILPLPHFLFVRLFPLEWQGHALLNVFFLSVNTHRWPGRMHDPYLYETNLTVLLPIGVCDIPLLSNWSGWYLSPNAGRPQWNRSLDIEVCRL